MATSLKPATCDYGPEPVRPARRGEELVIHRLPTDAVGLMSPAEMARRPPHFIHPKISGLWTRLKSWVRRASAPSGQAAPMVCVPPGAQLLVTGIPEDLQLEWGVSFEENAFFVQANPGTDYRRDAVCFLNGNEVLLEDMREGIGVRVLDLGRISADKTLGEARPAA